MADIAKVREVRERSGAGVADCGKALDEAGGDVEKALEVLQKKGILRAEAKSSRTASEGLVLSYIHGGKIGVLLEVNCETDFVARNPDFYLFCENVAMQIAAASPRWVREEEVPAAAIMKQREIYEAQLVAENKPEKAWAKIIEGKLRKWYSEVCLLSQPSVIVEGGKTVEQLRAALVAKLGENVSVRRFVRWEVGEGIQRRGQDYVSEVAKLMEGT